jgi:hypothetical protein
MTEPRKRPSRTWVGAPKGHLELPEARRRALEKFEKAETAWAALLAVRDEKFVERARALKAAETALAAVREAHAEMERAKEWLVYTMGQADE